MRFQMQLKYVWERRTGALKMHENTEKNKA